MQSDYEVIPVGTTAHDARPGDFILCHRKGIASSIIRLGEKIRYPVGAYWSHAAFIETSDTIIEALSRGVVRSPLSAYQHIEYILVRTKMVEQDQAQAVSFARSCIGMHYGFLNDFGIALRYLTPGRGLWFGMTGSEICSGLVAQAETRGWAIYQGNPASLSPTELAIEHGIPRASKNFYETS